MTLRQGTRRVLDPRATVWALGAAALSLVLGLASVVPAQAAESGSVQGTVVDSAGQAVGAGYSLTFVEVATGKQNNTLLSGGNFQIADLAPGGYRVWFNDDDDDLYYSTEAGTVTVVANEVVTRNFIVHKQFSKIRKVKIRGTAAVKYKLRADAQAVWRPTPVTFKYRWNRDGVPIGGATDRRYTVKPKDVGKRITVKVTASSPGYATTSASALAPKVTARK